MLTAEKARARKLRPAPVANNEVSRVLSEIEYACYLQDAIRHDGYLEDDTIAVLIELGYTVVAHRTSNASSYDIKWKESIDT